MYAKNVLAVSGALLSAVAAVPMANKRDIVWVTHTDVVLETVQATSTVWVNPGEQSTATVTAAATPSHYGHAHHSQATSSPVEPASPSSVAQPSSSSSSSSSSSTYVAPTTTSSSSSSSTSVYVAPTTPSTTSVAPTTTSAPATSSTPSTTSSSIVSTTSSTTSSAAAAATSSSSSSGSPSGDVLTGEATYYTPGLGSCGTTASESDQVVAIAWENMDNGANSNNNPNCNKWINIEYNGKTTSAKVVDTCPGCSTNGLDLSPVVFEKLADLSVGRLHGVTWSYQS